MKKIQRSSKERIIAGVCGGFAEYFNIDPVLLRIIWVALTIFGGSGIIAYILAILMIPDAGNPERQPISRILAEKNEQSRIWGIGLLVVGFIIAIQYNHLAVNIFHGVFGIGFNLIFAGIIISAGLYLLSDGRTDILKSLGLPPSMPLHLSKQDRIISGVCGGIAECYQLDPAIVRMVAVFGTFMSPTAGFIAYIVLLLLLPKIENFNTVK